MPSVRTLMTAPVATVGARVALARAAEQMAAQRISSLVVTGAAGEAVGMLTERDILTALRNRTPGHTLVEALMSRQLRTVGADSPAAEAHRLMLEFGVHHLLALEADGRLAGMLSDSNLRPYLVASHLDEVGEVRFLMNRSLPILSPGASVLDAVTLMDGLRCSCVVVESGLCPVGILTMRDVVRLFDSATPAAPRALAEVMSSPVFTVAAEAPPHQAWQLLQQHRLRHLVVVERDGRIAGLISQSELIQHRDHAALTRAVLERQQLSASLSESEAKLRAIFDSVSDMMGLLTPLGSVLDANRPALDFAGIPLDAVLGRPFWETPWWSHLDDARPLLQEAIRRAAAGETVRFETTHRGRDGQLRTVEFALAPIRGDDGRVLYLLPHGHDISARREAETRLRLAASVFDNAHDGIIITDPRAHILDVNTAFERLTGYRREEVLGHHTRLLKSGRQDQAFYQRMWQALQVHGQWQGEIVNRRRDGSDYVERLSISAVRDRSGAISHYLGVFSDITALKESQRRLEQLAHYDPLTRLPNRVLLADRLAQTLARTRRRGDLTAVCYLDLDGFKPINDRLGHHAGDRLLVAIARRLEEELREEDTVARLGGDEFVLILAGLRSREELEGVLGRVLQGIARPVHINGEEIRVSASVGVSLYPEDDAEADALLRHADQAMYVAKGRGRATYHVFDPSRDRLDSLAQQELDELRRAFARDELCLHYQPKLNLRSGEVTGFEALVRWQHPSRGLLPPAAFLPLVDEAGLGLQLDQWVARRALQQLAAWRRSGLALGVSVNIGAGTLQAADFARWIGEQLAGYPELPPGALELEVLESSALDDIDRVAQLIAECTRLGVHFALDDFGTGYSSLTYLRRLPARSLKVDRSFVAGMLSDPGDLAIVEAVLGLAFAFNRVAVAEGVEHAGQARLLQLMGCEVVQGYGISPPMPAAAVPGWLQGFRLDPAWSSPGEQPWLREDLPLLAVELAHRRWVDGLLQLARAPHDAPPVELHERHCGFGKWYAGQGQLRYGHLPRYQQLGSLHEALHHTAVKMLDQAQAPERQDGLQALLLRQSEDLLAGIRALRSPMPAPAG